MPQRRATAVWNGSLTEGNGKMRMASGAYEGPYSFQSRFEEGDGTNPEELIAAAHAGCFSMALSGELGNLGHTPDSVERGNRAPRPGRERLRHQANRPAHPRDGTGRDRSPTSSRPRKQPRRAARSRRRWAVESIELEAELT